MTAIPERKLDDVIETLQHSRDTRKRGCSLLIGAGCSVTAGIATAAGFVELIKQRFKAAHDRATDKTYPACMAELARGQQRDLINDQVSKARINWAHMAIAQLMRNGYVDRVLTTNFDPLVLRASAMLGEFPAVYDFALSQLFRAGELPEKAVFHLHGQSTGFVLMNTQKEVEAHSKRLGPLFHDAGQARPWVVVGYSGDNDPVFDHLAAVERFDYGLYWVGFKDEEPRAHIREELLQSGKDAYFIRGYDADRFFVELAQRLECFPPEFVQRPFSFLKSSLSTLTEYRQLSGDKEIDILHSGFDLIDRAIADIEKPSIELNATALLMAAKYEDLERLQGTLDGDEMTPSLRETFAWSYIMHGNALLAQGQTKSGVEADRLLAVAGEKYAAALAIKPDKHEAFNNWGNALSHQARVKRRVEADRLFVAAGEKYQAALAIKPDLHEALNNWGNALSDQARMKSGAEADRLFMAAGKKYQAALAIKPDMHEALHNWGVALTDQAKTKRGAEAEALFAAAGERYQAALAIKPDKHEALKSWGAVSIDQSRTKSGAEAEELLKTAGAKCAAALKLKPNDYEALYNWGTALFDQAKTKSDAEAEALFAAAGEKYQAALAIKPDMHLALKSWGSLYLSWSAAKEGYEVEHMLKEAEVKLLEAEEISTGCAAYNLACVAARRGDGTSCQNWLQRSKENGMLPDRQHLLADPYLASVRDQPWFRTFLEGE